MIANSPIPPAAQADPIAQSRLRRLLERAENFRKHGQIDFAIDSLEQALRLKPDDVPTLLQVAELQLKAGRYTPGRAAAMRALEGHLDSPKTALRLVRLLGVLSESGLLLEVARQIPPHVWDSANSLVAMALELSMVGAHGPAREFVRAALAREPEHPPSLAMAATIDVFHGDLDAAAEHAERCLRYLPNDSGMHWQIARLRLPGGEQRVPRIERALALNPPLEDQARLAYALHDELHNLGEYDRAWAALEHGCRAQRAFVGHDRDASQALFDALLEWTPGEIAQGGGHDDPRLAPVFVIGLHRSGTTLAERILTGHSRVAAGGETYDMRAAVRRVTGIHFNGDLDLRAVQARAGLDYRALGADFLRRIAWRAGGSPMVTDKLPSNYYMVGFIARALPHARFIHLNRDPIDVGLSSLRTLFSHAATYSYGQEDYVHHYRNYRRLMDHWRQLLPDRILDVQYQDLVDRPEETAARMAAFCGLDYEPAMVSIEQRKDAVSTASSVMMREGIRRDRSRVWARYERHLGPLVAAFPEYA